MYYISTVLSKISWVLISEFSPEQYEVAESHCIRSFHYPAMDASFYQWGKISLYQVKALAKLSLMAIDCTLATVHSPKHPSFRFLYVPFYWYKGRQVFKCGLVLSVLTTGRRARTVLVLGYQLRGSSPYSRSPLQRAAGRNAPNMAHSGATMAEATAQGSADSTTPQDLLRDLVRQTMALCFTDKRRISTSQRIGGLRDIQRLTQQLSSQLVLGGDAHTSEEDSTHGDDDMRMASARLAPPRAYFLFRENGRMRLPRVDWGAFRGYSMAFWINVQFASAGCSPRRRRGSSSGIVQGEGTPGKSGSSAIFHLYRFTNASNTLGEEAWLEYAVDTRENGAATRAKSVILHVRSCSPCNSDPKKGTRSGSAAIAHASGGVGNPSEWRHIQQRVDVVPGQWHLLVLSHSLHYVKKSEVTCFVDGKLQGRQELVYPSGLVTASKCSIGGGQFTSAKLASVTMYHDELPKDTVAMLYAQGPMLSSFHRTSSSSPAAAPPFTGFEDTTVNSPLTIPFLSDLVAAVAKLQIVFCFTAHDMANAEEYDDVGVEWLSEGTPSGNGKWTMMESTAANSAEIQQRHAKLDKQVHKVSFVDIHAAWYRSFGVTALPSLLHYILSAYEKMPTQDSKMTTGLSGAVEADDDTAATLERIVINLLWILKGLLLNNPVNQQRVLQQYVLHMLAHVMIQHPACLAVIWTPRSMLACVDVVRSLFSMVPSRKSGLQSINHPLQESIWSTNPLFASGIRALLLDFRLWTSTTFKTQSIYTHQLYGLVCEYPRAFNEMQIVPKVLEILRVFYAPSSAKSTNHEQLSGSQNSKHTLEQDQHWKQQCVQTLMDVIEICITNQSVLVHEVLEQELLDTTFAHSVHAPIATPGMVTTQLSSANSSSVPSVSPTPAAPLAASSTSDSPLPARQGGVFRVNLENIVWSDQTPASVNLSEDKEKSPPRSVLPAIQARFSLVRDLRAILRFLVTSGDAVVSTSILIMLRRLAVSFLDMRFALISSNIVDCLLFLMRQPPSPTQPITGSEPSTETANDAMRIRMACVPLFIYLLDWLESVEGRTVWCGLEEHLRLILNGEGSFSIGFLELMMEFYFDPTWCLGVQQSIIMNDPSKKESFLFPISSASALLTRSLSFHESGILVATDDGLLSTGVLGVNADVNGSGAGGASTSSINGLHAWIKMASQFVGKRLALSWEKRVSVIQRTAIRNLTLASSISSLPVASKVEDCEQGAILTVAELFDDGVSGILNLPLRGMLPFLPSLLGNSSPHFREKVLMDINVKLKTDENLQQQLLLMKRGWAESLLELALACAHSTDEDDATNEAETTQRGRAYSFDAKHTGEDLVLDTVVSLLCTAMSNVRGWRSFTDLISALKIIRLKYDAIVRGGTASPPTLLPVFIANSELYCRTLDWLSRVAGIVLQRMSRTRTILSRVLAENVQKVLYLVLETLLALPLKATTRSVPTASPASSLQKMGSGCVFSEAQLFLLNAVLDMNSRLIASTHKLHRIGLVPGLQILLRSLPYVSSLEMMERTVVVLVAAFQQEMSSIAGIRIYESVPTRDIFLSALVCLRRSLLVQEDGSLVGSLRVLTLRISTSGLFTEELQSAGLTVQYLSDATEEEAVLAVLDALALAINDAEMHEREEEADLVPYFPIAKELRYLNRHQLQQDGESSRLLHQTSSSMSDSAGDGSSDINDDVLWAALEVEENRMMETVRNVAGRETQRMTVGKDAVSAHKKEWSTRLWVKQEITFRSQYQHHAFASEDPETLKSLQNSLMFRLGRYETPQPGRVRRSLAIDLDSMSKKPGDDLAKSIDSVSSTGRETRRRQLSLSLELLHGIEGSDIPHTAVNIEESELLLERVGRMVAEQRGGEIQDITTDCGQGEQNHSAMSEDQRPSTDTSDENTTIEQMIEDQNATAEEEKRVNRESSTRVPPSAMSAMSASQTSWHLDMERYYEKGLDPGEGIAIFPKDQVLATAICRRVIPEGMVYGDLFFCNKHLVFEPHQSRSMALDPTAGLNSDIGSNAADEAAPGLHRCWRWKYRHIAAVYLRRYRLRDSALEIFLRDGSNHFLDFPHAVKQQRNELVRFLYSFLPRNVPKQWPGRGLPLLGPVTKAWQTRQISNFEYLMALNTFAGRSFNDLTQYPVFPWVLSNYESEILDLSDPHNFRDLSKPMGALNATRLEEYWERYHSFDDPVIPKFLYGSHYSTCAGVVLFFLFRLQPFAELHRKMQSNDFDLPDRLFSSIQETWRMCNSQMSEVKELTPEFYCNANFLKNLNHFALGKRHDQRVVNDVQLPPWAKTPEEFVTLHRAALESELVSQHLHEWVDLIFGFKQRGKAALKANNVFYYLTYYGVVDLDLIEDPFLKESMELQIAHFGQCPMQLFGAPHPKRNAPIPVKRTQVSTNGMNMSSPILGASTSSAATSPGPNSVPSASSTPTSNNNSANNTNVARPLSLAFRDPSPIAQERRRHWSPPLEVKPLVKSTIRLVKIFPDRFLSVSELGVIEMYHWKLVPKPQPSPPQSAASATRLSESELAANLPQDVTDHQSPSTSSETPVEESSLTRSVSIDPIKTSDSDFESTTNGPRICPATSSWLLETVRDDTPFDFVPRVPVFEESFDQAEVDARIARSPLAISLNGRLLISGGARNGALHLRLLDLDNGHVIGKASVIGHDDAVTCFSVDKWTYNAPPGSQDEEELLLSGSKDGSLAVWRLSHIKQDLMFRLPRVSSSPLLVLRGHLGAIVDCNVSTYLGVAASCSKYHGIVHFLHEDGQVAFTFAPAKPSSSAVIGRSYLSHVRVSIKGFVLAVTRRTTASRATATDAETTEKREIEVVSCTYQVFNLSGVLVHEQEFESGDNVLDIQLSAEGDLIIWTLAPGTIRICRLEEYVIVSVGLSCN